MSRDDIMNMPVGRELDALVAEKVMGIDCRNITTGEKVPYYTIQYSICIADAWGIFEKIRGMNYWIGIEVFSDKHRCLILSRKDDITGEFVSESVPEAICKAALLAVME